MTYRREIDGIRALAVLPVILFHAGIWPFTGGFVGVDIFFVISGYLIFSTIYTELQAGKFSLGHFYERRVRRILPALFVVSGTCVAFSWFWLLPEDLISFSKSLIAVSGFVSNIYFWKSSDYFQPIAELMPLLHTWSLSVEEQFYILFPPVLLLIWQRARKTVLALITFAICASLILAQWASIYAQVANFYLLPTRAFELLVGVWVALKSSKIAIQPAAISGLSRQAYSLLGLFLIVLAFVFFNRSTPFPSIFTLVPVVGCALLLVFCDENTLVGRLLACRPIVGVGLISYSLYLWHQPIFAFARIIFFNELSLAMIVGLIALTTCLSILTWRYVESPFRDKCHFSSKQIFLFAISGLMVFTTLGLSGVLARGFPNRLMNDVAVMLHQVDQSRQSYGDGCHLEKNDIRLKGCVKGSKGSRQSVALLGDSHAASLVQVLDSELNVRGIALKQFTKNGCPFAIGFLKRDTEHCDAYLAQVLDELSNSDIEIVVIATFWSVYLDNKGFDNGEGGVRWPIQPHSETTVRGVGFDESAQARRQAILVAYKNSVIELLRRGKKVVLIYPIPEPGWDIPASFAKSAFLKTSPNHSFAARYSEYLSNTQDIRKNFDSIPDTVNLLRVKPYEVLCDTYLVGRCVSVLNSEVLYTDNNHLSNAGARLVLDGIADRIRIMLESKQ